ncbi:MAG TPA: hypothetical protein VGQ39_20270 [Pyrinomonadaceae bacterium]|nr:hypothetical protein [Pyrinomonadaceae bacterium]
MNPHRLTLHLISSCFVLFTINIAQAQKQKAPPGGRIAVVVDERLSALRASPELTGKLVRRIGRGRLVAIRAVKTSRDGIVFYLVNASSRTHGWIQREALISPAHTGEDQRLLTLIKSSSDFDRIVRARIFLNHFPRSPMRPEVLLLLGDAAEQASDKLSREAARRINDNSIGPEFSYFLNYPGLDRYNRQGLTFVFDQKSRRFHYGGSAWQEIVNRYPRSSQVKAARDRLAELSVSVN